MDKRIIWLDLVLEWFCMSIDEMNKHEYQFYTRKNCHPYEAFDRIIKWKQELIDFDFQIDYIDILDKLVQDNYLFAHNGMYSITVDGRMFNEKGGYKGQLRREANKQKMQNSERIVLALGTTAAGVAGIWELFSNEVTRSILVSIFLSVLAVIILPSLSLIVKKK